MARISLKVDGAQVSDDVEPRMLLVQYLREKLGKTGTVVGCDTSNCGACTVHLDGRSVKSCNVLAVQADGHEVTTIEGLADTVDGDLHPVQEAFRECHGLQCGFCTPGMIMQSVDLLNDNPNPTEEEVRLGLEGNLCRCTGYHNIVKSVLHAAKGGATRMTATQERPAAEIGRDRRRKEDQRLITGRTRWTDNLQLPGHAAPRDGAQPVRARDHHRHRHRGREGRARRRRRHHRRRRRATSRASIPTAWPITPDQKSPAAPADRGRPGRVRRRDRRRRGRPHRRRGARRRRAGRRRLRRAAGSARPQGSAAADDPACSPTPTSAPTSPPSGSSTPPRPAPAATSTRPSRRRAANGIVIEREYRQQRLIPAFMEPRSVRRATRPASSSRCGPRPRSRTSLRFFLAAVLGIPESKIRVIAPDVGGGFGGKLQYDAGGDHHRARVARRARQAVQVHRDPLGVADGGPPRPRPVADADARGRPRTAPSPGSRSTCSPTSAPTPALVGGGVPMLGAFMFNAIYKFPAYQFNCTRPSTPTRRWTDAYRGAGPARRRRTPSSG